MRDPKWLDDPFLRSKKIGTYWYNHASDLHAGALVLWWSYTDKKLNNIEQTLGLGSSFRLGAALPGVFMLLAGLSIELLFKACIVRRNGDDAKVKAIHDLNVLARDAKFKVTRQQKKLLELLSFYITWMGKYPVPKRIEEYERADEFYLKAARKKLIGVGKLYVLYPFDVDRKKYHSFWLKVHGFYWEIKPFHDY